MHLCECLLIAGILNGWMWMQEILKDEGYFMDKCNDTLNAIVDADGIGDFNDLSFTRRDKNITMNKDGIICKCCNRPWLINVTI